MCEGWIKLHRSLTEWEWYDDANVMRLFLHLLLNVNHEDNKWHGIPILKGQILTGRLKLAQALNLTEMQIRTALNKLKSTNEITIKSTKQYSIITLNNWDKFQGNNQEDNQQLTNEQPTDNQRVTTNKNEKNERKKENVYKRKVFTIPSLSEVKTYCSERNNTINAQYFIDFYSSKGWCIGKEKMKDWKAAVRTWEQKEKKERKNEPRPRYREI